MPPRSPVGRPAASGRPSGWTPTGSSSSTSGSCPGKLAEVECRTGADVAWAIREMVVRGAPAIGQAAAYGLALTARRGAELMPFARRATIRTAASALRNARPTAANLGWAVDRMLARMESVGSLEDDGTIIADAMWAEADAICSEATRDHGRLAEHGLARLPTPVDRPLQILTHCNTGPLACGQFGTALGVVQAAVQAGRQVHVHVDETRPYLQGARLTAWELEQAGVPYTLIADAAAGALLASGAIDAVLVGADRVAANGDTANKIGTYPLAALAARHRVPFYVCAPLSSVDLETRERPGDPDRGADADRGSRVRRRPGRTARGDGLEPCLRRDPGRAHLGDRDRGGCAGCAIRPGAGRRGRGKAGSQRVPRRGPGDGLMATIAVRGGRDAVVARTTTDRRALRAFLERDRLFAAYAICDLDDREFARTRWGAAYENDELVAVALEYAGLSPQPLFVMGSDAGIASILRDVIKPRAAYVAALPGSLGAVAGQYRLDPGPPMVRMWVDRSTFRPYPADVRRLLPVEIGDLNRLYQLGFASWLPSSAISDGVYYGLRVGGRLVAAAGTHVISQDARLAVVGNVLTHNDYRGRGFATATTGAVTADLLRTCDQIVLNVRSDNPPALQAYRRLGYAEHVRFEERLVHRIGSPWPGLPGPLRRFLISPKENPPR